VGFDRSAWEVAVQTAAIQYDETALRSLFEQGRSEMGAQAGQEWARILSALDAGAVTG
jgi:hypothetical protein